MTCDFAGVFEVFRGGGEVSGESKRKAKAIDQSLRLRLRSGLRQSGDAFGVRFIGTPEGVPFRGSGFFRICGVAVFIGTPEPVPFRRLWPFFPSLRVACWHA